MTVYRAVCVYGAAADVNRLNYTPTAGLGAGKASGWLFAHLPAKSQHFHNSVFRLPAQINALAVDHD